ncbi:MAG: arsenite methyltransferase [Anaerolineales bacterium]|nr:arsenite methyltransferase [Anaerolineales bacterium]
MSNAEEIKSAVRERYAEIVLTPQAASHSCCAPASAVECGCMNESYAQLPGYVPDADYGLGCGLPTETAYLQPGQTVLDLGSGAGNDAFVARAIVGESGHVIGVDMTAAMITKARANTTKLGFTNVEFRLGEIENLPVEANTVDVVVSNCVLNLVPDKTRAFAEVLRVLKPGGHFSISDIVVEGELPEAIRQSMEAYAGCVAGAIQKAEYLQLIERTGFVAVRVAKEKAVAVPDELAVEALGEAGAAQAKASGARLLSVTVYGEKPLA